MKRTESVRFWTCGAGVVALLLLVVGWFFLISPQRSATASAQNDLATTQLQDTTLQTRIATLTAEQSKLPAYHRAVLAAEAALPSVDDQNATPDLLRTLQAISQQTATGLSGLSIDRPAAASTAPSAAATASSTATPAAGAVPNATPAAQVLSSTVSLAVSGGVNQLTAFLDQLQLVQPRAVLISSVSLGSSTSASSGQASSSSTMHLTMTVFFTPSTAASTPTSAAASPAAPTPTASGS